MIVIKASKTVPKGTDLHTRFHRTVQLKSIALSHSD